MANGYLSSCAVDNESSPLVETFPDEHRLTLACIAIHFAACGLVAAATNTWLFWMGVGAPALLFPMAMVLLFPAAFLTRLVISAACMTFVLLGVEQTSGYREAHFSFFVMITILAVYRDWRLLIFASTLVIIHHVGFTIFDPQAVGFYEPNDGLGAWHHVGTHLSVGLLQVFALCYLTVMLRRREAQSAALGSSLSLAKERADRDPLTGLFNRNHLESIIERFWNEAEKRRSQNVLCMIDIDHFKKVNDRYGHATGDDVLRAVAGIILEQSRQGDCTIRYGGEEFIVVLPHSTAKDAVHFAERVRGHVATKLVATAKSTVSVTISIGVAASHPHETFDDLFKRADEALYLAKSRGRNRVEECSEAPVWHTEMLSA